MNSLTFSELEEKFGAETARRMVEVLETRARYEQQLALLDKPMEERLKIALTDIRAA